MPTDAVRVRSIDDVILVFIEPERDFTAEETQRWYDALARDNAKKVMVLSVGPVRSEPERRRRTIELLLTHGLRLVAVSDHRLNRGLVGMFSYLGVQTTAYAWSRLEDAARDVASRPELVGPIVRAALALRAESPAAIGLEPDEG